MGFGTGLNALMTWIESDTKQQYVSYTGYEKYPLRESEFSQLHYGELFHKKQSFDSLHHSEWNQEIQLSDFFRFHKIDQDIFELDSTDKYDIVYFDAFAPAAQNELWSVELFEKIYDSLRKGGILVTYCAKGQVKRNLRAVGFVVEGLPGPPGKREMTRARK